MTTWRSDGRSMTGRLGEWSFEVTVDGQNLYFSAEDLDA